MHSSHVIFDGCGVTPFIRQCLRVRRFVCVHCTNPLENLAKSLLSTLHVLKATNINMYYDVDFACGEMHFQTRVLYIYYQSWATSTTTLMNKVDMKRIFVPFHFSWNHTWIWTICRQLRTWLKKFQNFKAFNKPYMLNGVDRLVSQSKAQQIRFYVQDDGVLAMHFKFFCTLPNWNWGPKDGRLVWHQGKDGKCMLSDGELNPCTSDPMMNEPTFIKGIPNQLSIGKKLCEEV